MPHRRDLLAGGHSSLEMDSTQEGNLSSTSSQEVGYADPTSLSYMPIKIQIYFDLLGLPAQLQFNIYETCLRSLVLEYPIPQPESTELLFVRHQLINDSCSGGRPYSRASEKSRPQLELG